MTEFIHSLMHPLPNAVTTVLVGVLLIYWIFVFLLGLGFDDIDLGFDFDIDIDAPDGVIDADADADTDISETSTEKTPGFMMKFLSFINVGKVPFMLILSTLKFFTWVGSLITTTYIDVTSWGTWSLLILIPISVIAVFITKLVTTPMAKFFKEIGYKGEEEIDFLGRPGKMLSNIKGDKIGTAEFVIDKNPIKLNVKSINGDEIKYGEYVIVENESEDKKIYMVSKEISIRNF